MIFISDEKLAAGLPDPCAIFALAPGNTGSPALQVDKIHAPDREATKERGVICWKPVRTVLVLGHYEVRMCEIPDALAAMSHRPDCRTPEALYAALRSKATGRKKFSGRSKVYATVLKLI